MAPSFRRDTPVLLFSPRSHANPGPFRDRAYTLWPALAYRVVAPRVAEHQIDILQKAVLGLCRAGQTRADDIGALLHLSGDLVVHILKQLLALTLIDSQGNLTTEGLAVLQDELIGEEDLVAGYVFQDPWTGELWPRFVEQLEYADTVYGENGYPRLRFGTTGRPSTTGAFMVFPESTNESVTPDAYQILGALSRSRRALDRAGSVEFFEDEEDNGVTVVSSRLEKVSLVDDLPLPVYLTTFLYVPHDGGIDLNWYVCDPFGLGLNALLRQSIRSKMHDNVNLRNAVDRLLGNVLGSDVETQLELEKALRERAETQVEARLTLSARELPCWDHLVEAEIGRMDACQYGAGNCPPRVLDAIAVSVRKALEASFADIIPRYPDAKTWQRLYVSGGRRPQGDREYVRRLYEEAAKAAGFAVPVPAALANTKPGHVKSVVAYADWWHLRACIMAALLQAEGIAGHPLREAAQVSPGFLGALDGLVAKLGAAAHHGRSTMDVAEAMQLIDDVHQTVAALFGLSPVQIETHTEVTDEQTKQA